MTKHSAWSNMLSSEKVKIDILSRPPLPFENLKLIVIMLLLIKFVLEDND